MYRKFPSECYAVHPIKNVYPYKILSIVCLFLSFLPRTLSWFEVEGTNFPAKPVASTPAVNLMVAMLSTEEKEGDTILISLCLPQGWMTTFDRACKLNVFFYSQA
ncbi:hypothetical protein NPIL_133821 [Nephila pilipes]|uniref:Uncharacterized protein n=1 Tax=Nephila pilipes TaxID=299642 RepID=A0A8X6NC11_NEPPI|nr:hypothetical protein NPIL_133821 [Nephila pilipes]